MRERAIGIAAAVAAVLLLASCDEEKHERGFDYMPDMYQSPAYRTQEAREVEIEVVVDAKTGEKRREVHHVPMMLTPPDGAVPRDFLPYQIPLEDVASAKAQINPLAPTPEVLKHGQWAFGIYCAVCHGNDGDAGKNSYVGYKFGGILPLNSGNLLKLTDGDIYHIVTYGRTRMPNYRAQLLPQTRWSVIHYLRVLNRASVAKLDADAELADAEKTLKDKPDDADAKAKAETARLEQVAKKLALDQLAQRLDGAEFIPPPAAVPEYITPTWLEK